MPLYCRRKHACSQDNPRGYSLVEVVIATGLFALLAGGIIATTLVIRSTAEETVYQNTALTVAQAYLEQIRSTDYGTLRAAAEDTGSTIELALVDSAGATLTDEDGNQMNNGDWAREVIMLDEKEDGTPIQPMTFRFRPVLTSLSGVTSSVADGVEVILHYEITYNFGLQQSHNGSLRTVRSNVPTY